MEDLLTATIFLCEGWWGEEQGGVFEGIGIVKFEKPAALQNARQGESVEEGRRLLGFASIDLVVVVLRDLV